MSEYVNNPPPLFFFFFFFFRASTRVAGTHGSKRTDCTTPIQKETGCNHMMVCAHPSSLQSTSPCPSSDIDAIAHFFPAVHFARVQHSLLLRLWWHDRPIRAEPRDRSGCLGTLSQVPAVRSPELTCGREEISWVVVALTRTRLRTAESLHLCCSVPTADEKYVVCKESLHSISTPFSVIAEFMGRPKCYLIFLLTSLIFFLKSFLFHCQRKKSLYNNY